MKAINHYIESQFKGCTYRYYGYEHIPGAVCVGEGDWRAVADGKECRTNGVNIPTSVLASVVAELEASSHE